MNTSITLFSRSAVSPLAAGSSIPAADEWAAAPTEFPGDVELNLRGEDFGMLSFDVLVSACQGVRGEVHADGYVGCGVRLRDEGASLSPVAVFRVVFSANMVDLVMSFHCSENMVYNARFYLLADAAGRRGRRWSSLLLHVNIILVGNYTSDIGAARAIELAGHFDFVMVDLGRPTCAVDRTNNKFKTGSYFFSTDVLGVYFEFLMHRLRLTPVP